MKRICTLILSLIVGGHLTSALALEKNAPSKPNIIMILSDDVGLGDIGFTGGPLKTPHIDALAKSGTRFEFCYATPLCGPSRCQLLTGRYPFRTGLINNQSHQAIAPEREIMIPTALKKAGYVTASAGKWGQMALGPGEFGFDEYIVFPGSGRYWRDQSPHYRVNGEQKELAAGEYLPDIMHDFVVKFINQHKDQPFFIYYPMSHIHGPILRTPDSKPGADKDQLYRDNVAYMDKLVGKLVAELDRLKLREKTLVIFTGDNGTARFGVEMCTVNGKPISGQKATMLEGGSRVPLLANWPGVTPAGAENHDLIDFSDFFSTFTDLAGAPSPKGVKLDSHSFAQQIQGKKGNPRDWVYVELNGKSYVRDSHFKLTNRGELFDLTEAPFKEIAVASSTTDSAAIGARKRLQALLDEHPTKPAGDTDKAAKKAKRKAKREAGKKE
jgi:arylsulfatase A